MRRRQHPAKFGHRSVRPGDIQFFRKVLLKWYAKSGRRFPWRYARATRFHQILSEVLLQRTRAETIAAYWPSFICRFPNWGTIASAPVSQLEELLLPLGLAKQRAPRLRGLALAIARSNGRCPTSREQIEALPGVGQYIANAIEMFVHGKPRPLMDVNMARVIERVFGPRKLADIRFDPYLQQLSTRLIRGKKAKELNWAILDLATLLCTSQNPACEKCPLRTGCKYARRTLN